MNKRQYIILFISIYIPIYLCNPIQINIGRIKFHPDERSLRDSHVLFNTKNTPLMLPMGGGIAKVGLFYTIITRNLLLTSSKKDTGSSTLYLTGKDCKLIPDGNKCKFSISYYDGVGRFKECIFDECGYCTIYEKQRFCGISSMYGDGSSVFAIVTEDFLSIGNRSVLIEFGQTYEQSSEFSNGETDGLMGLGYSSLSNTVPILDAIVLELNIPNIFSICFNQDGGSLIFGGFKSEYSLDTIRWTPIIQESYYTISLKDFSVNGRSLGKSYPPTIIDTGTTLILLPNNIYNVWRNAMQHNNCHIDGMCGENSIFSKDSCWFFDDLTLKIFPTIEFTFPSNGSEDISIILTPDMYFLDLVSNKGTKCKYLGISQNDQHMIVLGDTFLQNFHTIFDRENKQIGISRVNKKSCVESIGDIDVEILNSGLRDIIIIVSIPALMGIILLICSFNHKRRQEVHSEVEMKMLDLQRRIWREND